MNEKQKMLNGFLYDADSDPELKKKEIMQKICVLNLTAQNLLMKLKSRNNQKTVREN